MKAFFFVLISLLFSLSSSAQDTEEQTYFPLQVGNEWLYGFVFYDIFNNPVDTTFSTYSVESQVSVNDTLYYVVRYPFAYELPDTLRDDSEGRIWGRMNGEDVLVFDFTAADGTTYSVNHPSDTLKYEVYVTRPISLRTPGGDFDNGVSHHFGIPNVSNTGPFYVFVPGIGIVSAADGVGNNVKVFEARINNQIVTSRQAHLDLPKASGLQVSVYPNPASERAVITVQNAFDLQVVIYDALGRQVAQLPSASCSIEICTFHWTTQSYGAGVYYVTAKAGESIKSVPLMVVR